jgi:hypothetical protein
MKTSIPRLSKATFRDGRCVHVIRNTASEEIQRNFARHTTGVPADQHGKMAGFAIVAWGIDGSCSTTIQTNGRVGLMMVPDFAKTALTDHIAHRD